MHTSVAFAAGGSGQYPPIDPNDLPFGFSTTDVYAYTRAPDGSTNQDSDDNPANLPDDLFAEGPQFFGSLFSVEPAVGYFGVRSKVLDAGIISQSTGAQAVGTFDPVSFTCSSSGIAFFPGTEAAAACVDPRTVLTTSMINFAPVIDSMTLDIAGLGESAFARFFAEVDGQELFSVEIAAVDQLLTDADLLISLSFDLTRLTVVPAVIESNLRAAITVTSGMATLSSYTLFSSPLTLMAGEALGEGVIAGAAIAAVPEPATALLGLLGAGMLVAGRRRRGTGAVCA